MQVTAPAWEAAIPDIEVLCRKALETASRMVGHDGEISLLLTSDEEMHALNREWRAKDKPTDVLSFPADPIEAPFLGDIAVGYGISASDAAEKSISLGDHLCHLLIHGYLHLIGHDHIEDTQAEEMEALEVRALALLGLPDPYQ